MAGTPTTPIPDWSMLEQSGNQRCSMHAIWQTSPARHVENFNDLAHFATVHARTFGSQHRSFFDGGASVIFRTPTVIENICYFRKYRLSSKNERKVCRRHSAVIARGHRSRGLCA
jgi:vanillate O-demethylase monooxygenase subunit